MRIAIQAADLDAERIDGTRVYIYNLIKHFGNLDRESQFLIFHRKNFNPELVPPEYPNYAVKKVQALFLWTQTGFAWEIGKEQPDLLWMPMHNIPLIGRRKAKTFVTIHDLAYKYFPEYFPKKDLFMLNFLGSLAIRKADGIIAVSESTKRDILKFYPEIDAKKIKVIHHGFDRDLFLRSRDESAEAVVRNKFGVTGEYILYSGAIQPRKNVGVLVAAFEKLKREKSFSGKLVLAGEKAWLWEDLMEQIGRSDFKEEIIFTGKVSFEDLGHLMRGAKMYVYPSLHEGFGITLLEVMASRVPLISASNSSLREVGGDAPLYFDEKNPDELAGKISSVIEDAELAKKMIEKGTVQAEKFSWEKCAQETLDYFKGEN